MSAVLNATDKRYRELLATTLPRVIHSEAENEQCIAALEALHERNRLSPEQEQLSELLTLLIDDFEGKNYQLNAASPVEIIRELMGVNSLKQSDLVDIFGTKSIVSEVLSGKRELSKAHIQRLCRRFHVSPELFFPVA
jgi:HTH-type transcriptional regulator/antitoxin HigA